MKRWKVVLLCAWLAFIAGMMCGCDKPFLPSSFAADLDTRIAELQVDIGDADADCRPLLQSDLDFLTSLRSASK
jgi:hypothetical protein